MSESKWNLRKSQSVSLKQIGLDESWLQAQIALDPSLLGLGDLTLIQRERSQSSGGRLDFLMYDDESETRYEIEVMLGKVDESHIIRTIEYWDIERQRFPMLEHRAVIVAEEITSRFFNVIRLLNRAVPLMAIQLNAFTFGTEVVLQFNTVLDTYEFSNDQEDIEPVDMVDRAYWENRVKGETLKVVDGFVALVTKHIGPPRLTYNRGHIALGSSRFNFCWLHPSQNAKKHCRLHMAFAAEDRQQVLDQLESVGIEAALKSRGGVRFSISEEDLAVHKDVLGQIISTAERFSQR